MIAGPLPLFAILVAKVTMSPGLAVVGPLLLEGDLRGHYRA